MDFNDDVSVVFSARWAQRRDGKFGMAHKFHPDALVWIERPAAVATVAARRPSLATLMPDPLCGLAPAQAEAELEKEAEALALRGASDRANPNFWTSQSGARERSRFVSVMFSY